MLFPFVEAAAFMNVLLKHTNVTQLSEEHLTHITDWKSMEEPIRGTLLPYLLHHMLWAGNPSRKYF